MALPYFPFYRDDWRSSSKLAAMTLEERGAYIELLTHMWGFEGGCWLPDHDATLARLLGVSVEKWREIRAVLVDGPMAVFTTDGERLTNERLLCEWKKAESKSKKATANIQTRYERSTDVDTNDEPANNGRNTTRDLRSQIGEESNTPPISPPRGERRGKRNTQPDNRIKPLIDYYHQRFTDVVGYPPVINGGRDGMAIHRIPAEYDFDRLRSLLDFWLDRRHDKWIWGKGDIPAFVSALNRIVKEWNNKRGGETGELDWIPEA